MPVVISRRSRTTRAAATALGLGTAFFRIDPLTGLADSILRVTHKGRNIDFGFDAITVLPTTIGCWPRPVVVTPSIGFTKSIRVNGKAKGIKLDIHAGSGRFNGLDATSDSRLLATDTSGELLEIDLDSGDVSAIGQSFFRLADVAVQPDQWQGFMSYPNPVC